MPYTLLYISISPFELQFNATCLCKYQQLSCVKFAGIAKPETANYVTHVSRVYCTDKLWFIIHCCVPLCGLNVEIESLLFSRLPRFQRPRRKPPPLDRRCRCDVRRVRKLLLLLLLRNSPHPTASLSRVCARLISSIPTEARF